MKETGSKFGVVTYDSINWNTHKIECRCRSCELQSIEYNEAYKKQKEIKAEQ